MKTAKKKTEKSKNDILDIIEKAKNEKGGFFDLLTETICNHPEHNPPQHLYIPQGKGYRHVCPQCGHVTVIIPPQITY